MAKSTEKKSGHESASNEQRNELRSRGRFVGVFLGGMLGWLLLIKAARYILVNVFSTTSGVEWAATIGGAAIGFFIGGAAASLLATHSDKRLIRPFGLAVSIVMIFVWILPILWVGGSKKSTPGMPYYLQNMHRISCLFTHSSSNWKTVHYEVRFKGSGEWVEGFEPGFFPQSIFGYRGRFNRIIGQSLRGGARGGGRRWEVAKHIQMRWKELYPADPEITHVRYVRVVHPVFESHCMANEPWKKLPLATYPENQYRFEDTIDLTKRYKYVPKKKKKRSRKTKKKGKTKVKGLKSSRIKVPSKTLKTRSVSKSPVNLSPANLSPANKNAPQKAVTPTLKGAIK